LGELGFPVQTYNTLYCDNESVIQVTENLVAHSKMKQVELDAHYFRLLVYEKIFSLVYCRMNHKIVYIFTKTFSKDKFVKLRSMLGIQKDEIMGVFPTDLISPPKYPEPCVDWGGGGGVGTSSYNVSTHFS
jgi:hypothetical protein